MEINQRQVLNIYPLDEVPPGLENAIAPDDEDGEAEEYTSQEQRSSDPQGNQQQGMQSIQVDPNGHTHVDQSETTTQKPTQPKGEHSQQSTTSSHVLKFYPEATSRTL